MIVKTDKGYVVFIDGVRRGTYDTRKEASSVDKASTKVGIITEGGHYGGKGG